MNDRLVVITSLAAADWPNCSLGEMLERLPDMVKVADALIAAAGEGGDPALHENCVGVAIHNVIVDRIQGERDNAICRLTDRDARVATLQAKVASLERQLEPLTEDECVHLGGSYFTPADMVRVDSAIMAVKAGRGE